MDENKALQVIDESILDKGILSEMMTSWSF